MMGSGRPSKLSCKMLEYLKSSKYKRFTRELSRNLSNKGHNISKSSVDRYLKNDMGLKAFKRKRQPLITTEQRRKRLEFARKYGKLSEEDWENFVFSDESPKYLFYEPNSKNDIVWGSQEEKVPVAKTVKTLLM